jgi:sec-independent protein translocase protein TatA
MCRVGDLFTPLHLIIILVIVLVIFGPKRLPELGSGLGKAIRGFRDATASEPDRAVIDTAAENPQRSASDRGGSNAV